MYLLTSRNSPFARKVTLVLHETGLHEQVELRAVTTTPLDTDPALKFANPLGKIPCLVLDNGRGVYDSRVICEYLDTLHAGRRLCPVDPDARLRALTMQALGDGIADAAVSRRYEGFLRPAQRRWPEWDAAQRRKVDQALDAVEAALPDGDVIDIGTLSLACALGYLDFRYQDEGWRHGRPRLAAWFEAFSRRPSLVATLPG